MDLETLSELARSLTRDQFSKQVAGLYLAVTANADDAPIGFQTEIVRATTALRATTVSEVLAVEKAKGNPYPDRISVGRARNCDVVLRDPSVSKLHAHFHIRGRDRLELVDLGSQNGTRVERYKLTAHEPQGLRIGDELHFGRVAAKLVDAPGLYALLR